MILNKFFDRLEYFRQYYKNNKEKIRLYNKKWRENNKEKIRLYNKKYRYNKNKLK